MDGPPLQLVNMVNLYCCLSNFEISPFDLPCVPVFLTTSLSVLDSDFEDARPTLLLMLLPSLSRESSVPGCVSSDRSRSKVFESDASMELDNNNLARPEPTVMPLDVDGVAACSILLNILFNMNAL